MDRTSEDVTCVEVDCARWELEGRGPAAGCVCVKFDWCQFAVSGKGMGMWIWMWMWMRGQVGGWAVGWLGGWVVGWHTSVSINLCKQQ